MPGAGRWIAVGIPETITHGGSLRARYLFRTLIERTGALAFYRPDLALVRRALRYPRALLPGVNVAAAELLPAASLPVARRLTRLRILDLHDLPVLHAEALGAPLSPPEARAQDALTDANLMAFERIVVVSDSMAEVARVPPARCIVIGNGSDTTIIKPGPWPEGPTIGVVSAAAPGRGIEALIEACRRVRASMPELQLRLCLAATGAASRTFMDRIERSISEDPWAHIESVPYPRLSTFLAGTSVLVVPHPPSPSWDLAPTVKLFDYLAAGRPVVVTPRFEMARVVREAGAGIVAAGDHVDDLADAIYRALADEERARQFGARARRAAEEQFDWRILSDRLADRVLG
jgi:glycosyltransferase involved in cell wall biosynthesis